MFPYILSELPLFQHVHVACQPLAVHFLEVLFCLLYNPSFSLHLLFIRLIEDGSHSLLVRHVLQNPSYLRDFLFFFLVLQSLRLSMAFLYWVPKPGQCTPDTALQWRGRQ